MFQTNQSQKKKGKKKKRIKDLELIVCGKSRGEGRKTKTHIVANICSV